MADYPPLRSRLMVYEPDGALRGQLPVPVNWQMAVVMNDLSSMTLEYVNTAPGAEMLTAPCEVALELAGPDGVFQEHPDCRFLNIRQTQDMLQPDVTTKLTMPSYGWVMNKARNIIYQDFNDNGNRDFNAFPAVIIKTFIDEAHGRGNLNLFTYTFTATEDSNGGVWTTPLNVGITAGQDIYTTINSFAGQGLFDWRMNKRALELYLPDTFLNRDLTTNPTAVLLYAGRDLTAAPDDISFEDVISRALVQGDDNNFTTLEDPTNIMPWGEWEGFMQQGGITDLATMEQLGQRFLATGNTKRAQITREIIITKGSPLPIIDYRQGDHIKARDDTGTFGDLRVQQITLTMNNEQLSGNIVLGDKFTERDLRFQRKLAALTGGSNTIGGSGTTPTPPTPPPDTDTRTPKQVQDVTLGYDTTLNSVGDPVGTISAEWTQVTEATDNTPMDIDSYRVRWALHGTDAQQQTTIDGEENHINIGSSIHVMQTYDVSIAAIGANGIQGAWSEIQSILVGPDETPPPVPSTPVITSRVGVLRVHWDGRDEDGLNLPVDVKYLEVEMASAESGPFAYIGIIQSSAADLLVVDQTYGAERFFRMRALNTNNIYSDYSGIASGTANPTSTNDIEAGSITADKLAVGSVTAEAIAAYSIDATRLAVGGQRNLITDPNLADPILSGIRIDNANTSKNTATGLTWSWQNSSFFRVAPNTASGVQAVARIGFYTSSLVDPDLGSASGTINPMYAYPVDRTIGSLANRLGVNISLASGSWPSGASVLVQLYFRWVLADGTYLTTAIPIQQTYTAVTGGFVNLTGQNIAIPSTAVAVLPYARVEFDNYTNAMIVDISTPFLAQANTGVLIEDGAITANKIVANAIGTTQLDADAITAKHTITGALFQTDVTGERVVISPDANYLGQAGIRIYSGLSGNRDANIFTAANTTGGWTLGEFVIVGPEQTRNSSGRTDLEMLVGGAGFRIGGTYVSDSLQAGVLSPTGSNELLLAGVIPRGTATNDNLGAVRGFNSSFQNATITWGYNNGWAYRGAVCPNSPNSTPRYGSMQSSSATSFTYTVNNTVDNVDLWLYRGGFLGS